MSQLHLFGQEQAESINDTLKSASPLQSLKRRRRVTIHTDIDDISSKKMVSLLLRHAKKFDVHAKIAIESAPSPKERPWLQMPFLCVDTETTGLDRSIHRVIEVAWVMFEHEKELVGQSRLCSIDSPLPQEIIDLTGINEDMLTNQPPFLSHADELIEAMSKVEFIVAYNAQFDRLFLEAEMKRIGKSLPELPWIDPCIFIRELDRYQKGKKLSDATTRWGIELKGAHRALADAKATGLLLYKLAPHLKTNNLNELVKIQATWQEEQDRNFKAYLAKKQAQMNI